MQMKRGQGGEEVAMRVLSTPMQARLRVEWGTSEINKPTSHDCSSSVSLGSDPTDGKYIAGYLP